MKLTGYQPRTMERAAARELLTLVEEFNVDYCALLDAGEVERWPEMFTDDAIYRVTAKENAELGLPVGLIYGEGKKMLVDRAVAIARTQMFAPRYNLHLLGNTRVLEQTGPGEFSAQANFILLQTLVEGPTTLHLAGRYYDRFVQAEAGLLLRERQVVYDTTLIATDLVYPV